MRLFHFSQDPEIRVFHPRAPVRHPESEPLVYAIDEWHSPLYFFPRDCPRIALWPEFATTSSDRSQFQADCASRILIYLDQSSETYWREGKLFRYEFSRKDGFEDCKDHGVWVSRGSATPIAKEELTDLPKLALEADVDVSVVPQLGAVARQLYNYEEMRFNTTLHVSMIRLALLPGWDGPGGKPVTTK
jgi:hypothetical protein